MRIGILTLPLHTNYGGILQAYALQTVMERMGHEVVVANKREISTNALYKTPFIVLHRIWNKCIRKQNVQLFPEYYEQCIFPVTRKKVNDFIEKYIHLVQIRCYAQYFKSNPVDAIVVGSDQVWRPCYVDSLEDYFIGFDTKSKFRRIAYAASFGVDKWEFDKVQTSRCSELLKRFDAISVRENSGVLLCKQYLDREALHVLDPTMLLKRTDYLKIIETQNKSRKDRGMFCYVLDESERKSQIIALAASFLNQPPFFVKAEKETSIKNFLVHKSECVVPGVDEWIQSFENAGIVLTDSFHGCVFSIIFHKPFWVVINPQRGSARFSSLLSILHLEDRVISIDDKQNIDWSKPINWSEVDNHWENMRRTSLEFLTNSLS